jgi:hypothetical protein
VKLTYQPGEAWKMSLGARFGKTNHSDKTSGEEYAGSTKVCFNLYGGDIHKGCKDFPDAFVVPAYSYSEARVVQNEDHTIVDFEVRRDVGLGSLDERGVSSELGVGVRYAQLNSRTRASILGIPEWDLPEYFWEKYGYFPVRMNTERTRYSADLDAEREFTGAGPTLSWHASLPLMGSDGVGRLRADVAVTGGVLFGKQKTRINGEEVANLYDSPWPYGNFLDPESDRTPIDMSRSNSISVPLLDTSLGVSYEIDRMKVSAGYRWERYFNVLDVGYEEAEDGDRTIEGPYFKIAVGFGG